MDKAGYHRDRCDGCGQEFGAGHSPWCHIGHLEADSHTNTIRTPGGFKRVPLSDPLREYAQRHNLNYEELRAAIIAWIRSPAV